MPTSSHTHYGRASGVLGGIGLLIVTAFANAQELNGPPPEPAMPRTLRMQSILYDAEKFAEQAVGQPFAALKAQFDDWQIGIDAQSRVHIEIIGPQDEAPIPRAFVEQVGGVITNTWRHRTEAWVPVNRLITLEGLMPAGHRMQRAGPICHDAVGGQGATSINSDSYRDNGANGSGRVIAVIDGGYQSLTAAQAAGDAPANAITTKINYTPGTFEASANGAHGTGCVESAFDHCPGATWRLYLVDSLTDVGTAVNDGESNSVVVISHSLSWYNEGWADNSGDACLAANDAADGSTLFFTSAGNRADSHYQGAFSDTDADDWHNYSGGDELMDITTASGSDTYYLSWDNAAVNLDLYLYSSDGTTVVASSTNAGGTFEQFSYNPGASVNRKIAVRRVSGGATTFEVFIHNGPTIDQYGSAANSTTSPSNSTNSGVISNGAVTWSNHDSANGTSGIIASYSSNGPSNSGMTLPDITGPTDTTTTSNGGFGGTSGATPNNAGAACAFWSAHPGYSADAIRWLLYEQADLWKDWGTAGNDNVYGRGGTILTDWAFGTTWLARNYGNVANAATGPLYTGQAAYNAVVNNGRILVFPGGNYPEATNMIGTKAFRVIPLQNAGNFGF